MKVELDMAHIIPNSGSSVLRINFRNTLILSNSLFITMNEYFRTVCNVLNPVKSY